MDNSCIAILCAIIFIGNFIRHHYLFKKINKMQDHLDFLSEKVRIIYYDPYNDKKIKENLTLLNSQKSEKDSC